MQAEDFEEVADRVLVARHRWLDVNVTAVLGTRGLLVVDTLGSVAEAERMLDRLAAATGLGVLAAVNTHAHFDHVLGNAAVLRRHPGVDLVAHETTVEDTPGACEAALRAPDEHGIDQARFAEVQASPVEPAPRSFSSVAVIDLGDRIVEVVHCGRGHTAADTVVRVADADADVLVAGDLVEQSGPLSYGEDSWPLEWPMTLETASQLTTPATVVVPGHGAPVDQELLHDQRRLSAEVAETIHELVEQGVPVGDALAAGQWPFPDQALTHAVRRGYQHIGPTARRLPLA